MNALQFTQGRRMTSIRFLAAVLFLAIVLFQPLNASATEAAWPKQIHKVDPKDFASKAEFKSLSGIEKRDQYYDPGVLEMDLNGDGKTELILSYSHTPGQNKVCYYVFQKRDSEYKLAGKIYHCGLVLLESFNGFSQLEGWASGSEGVYVRALYQMCKDGAYKNTRMDVFRATRFTNDGGPIATSKVFSETVYPNPCD